MVRKILIGQSFPPGITNTKIQTNRYLFAEIYKNEKT
jgi:hypothetical protein